MLTPLPRCKALISPRNLNRNLNLNLNPRSNRPDYEYEYEYEYEGSETAPSQTIARSYSPRRR
jgi:hypothetical protein